MMAFVDNQKAIIGDNIGNVPVADKALDQRHINDARWPSFPAADNADLHWQRSGAGRSGVRVKSRRQGTTDW